jgi:hypothetical protein
MICIHSHTRALVHLFEGILYINMYTYIPQDHSRGCQGLLILYINMYAYMFSRYVNMHTHPLMILYINIYAYMFSKYVHMHTHPLSDSVHKYARIRSVDIYVSIHTPLVVAAEEPMSKRDKYIHTYIHTYIHFQAEIQRLKTVFKKALVAAKRVRINEYGRCYIYIYIYIYVHTHTNCVQEDFSGGCQGGKVQERQVYTTYRHTCIFMPSYRG